MDQVLPVHTSAAAPLDPDSEELQLRLGSFRKLGYSSEEVRSALRKLGRGTDTNSVLGELVRTRTGAAPCRPAGNNWLQPPSWALRARIPTQPGPQKNSETRLRPIVIDGSNVAMR